MKLYRIAIIIIGFIIGIFLAQVVINVLEIREIKKEIEKLKEKK